MRLNNNTTTTTKSIMFSKQQLYIIFGLCLAHYTLLNDQYLQLFEYLIEQFLIHSSVIKMFYKHAIRSISPLAVQAMIIQITSTAIISIVAVSRIIGHFQNKRKIEILFGGTSSRFIEMDQLKISCEFPSPVTIFNASEFMITNLCCKDELTILCADKAKDSNTINPMEPPDPYKISEFTVNPSKSSVELDLHDYLYHESNDPENGRFDLNYNQGNESISCFDSAANNTNCCSEPRKGTAKLDKEMVDFKKFDQQYCSRSILINAWPEEQSPDYINNNTTLSTDCQLESNLNSPIQQIVDLLDSPYRLEVEETAPMHQEKENEKISKVAYNNHRFEMHGLLERIYSMNLQYSDRKLNEKIIENSSDGQQEML